MDNETRETETEERKRGRPPGTLRPSNLVKVTILLDPEVTDWAKAQPAGVSGLVRQLLAEAYDKAKGQQK